MMRKIDFLKDVLPHLVAVLVFLIVVVLFFSPQITGNKALHQHDVFQGRAGGQELTDLRQETGEEGLWVNNMFSGMPGYLINVGYKDYVLSSVSKVLSIGLPNPASYIFMALICYYIMLLCFKVRPYLAIAGALIFGLTTFNIISAVAGHNSKIHALAYMPLVIAGIKLAFDDKRWLGFGLTALALALQLKANHLQMTYYLLLITIGYGLVELWMNVRSKNLKPFLTIIGILVIAAILAVGSNIGRLLTVYEYGQYSIRGKSEISIGDNSENQSGLDKEYAFRYSNGIFEPLVMFVPNILGGSSQQELDESSNLGEALSSNGLSRPQVRQQLSSVPTYWGDQPLTAPYYAGAITLLLFVIGILFAEKKYRYWLVSMTVLGVILSWGKNFETLNYILFDYLPGYNKFRSVTFAILIPIFCMPLLGMLGLERLLQVGLNPGSTKKLFIGLSVSGGFMLLLVLISGMLGYKGAIDEQLANLPPWFVNALRDDRASLLRSDALRSFLFIALVGSALWFSLKEKINATAFSAILIILMTVDMVLVGKRFLSNDQFVRDPYGKFAQATEADQLIIDDNSSGHRVLYLPNPFNDARTSYHHPSVGGYHGAKLRRYQDLIDHALGDEIQESINILRGGQRDFSTLGVLNMMDTRYLMAGSDRNSIIINNTHNGHAWFVEELVSVDDATAALIETAKIDTKRQAVIDASEFSVDFTSKNAVGTIKLIEKKPRTLIYETENDNDGIAVFSEVFYDKGWKAFIDEKEVPILRLNYLLRGLEVSKGKHNIRFEFNPNSYSIGSTAGLIFSIITFAALAFSIFLQISSKKNE